MGAVDISQAGIAGLRAKVHGYSVGAIKSRLFELETMRRNLPKGSESGVIETVILRMMAILEGELVRRGYHSHKDSREMLRWLDTAPHTPFVGGK